MRLLITKRRLIRAAVIALAVFVGFQLLALTGLVPGISRPFPELTSRILWSPFSQGDGVITPQLSAAVVIPRLNIRVPIVWSTSRQEADLQRDLEHGAIHYPGTALPGLVGNAFVSAHSSNFPWLPGDYKTAFASLGDLEEGERGIFIEYADSSTLVRRFEFQVAEIAIVHAEDERMFNQGDQPELTLVTCWPLGTSWRRLMVKGQLVEVQEP